MNWITESRDFDEILLRARECKYIDSGRHKTSSVKLEFDDAGICTEAFFMLLAGMMRWSQEVCATYVVLDPDPVNYFYRLFRKYPALNLGSLDTTREYLDRLNESPEGGSTADSIAANWNECAIFSKSDKWFIHALRDDGPTGGHIWVPELWSKKVVALYPPARAGGAP